MPTDGPPLPDPKARQHARMIAAYLARTVPEREYRKTVAELQRKVGREPYRRIHDAALRLIGEAYLDAN